jgi:DNA polymerase III subunit alpha
MDFLGLRTLTVVHEAVRIIRESHGVEIDIDELEPDDEKTYALLRSGETTGIFQLESSGMRDVARRIGLQSLEEVSALVALYRPGPMQFIDTYIEGKYHPETIRYDHPITQPILEETYGIAIYQEQVMQLVQACGGFSLGQADIVRRAMGKKKVEEMQKQRVRFIEGCKEKEINEDLASVIWDKIATFAGYGFNKSHSMAYAFVAYQTAFLKANYPVEFMCALLTSESGNLDKVAIYVEECRRMKIDVLPPDVNHSQADFSVAGKAIRFGLCAIKNVGRGPTGAIVETRNADGPFRDIFDFCGRLDTHQINRKVVESLNRAGAFASTEWNRRQIEAVIEQALSEGQIAQRERESGQTSLFELSGMAESAEAIHTRPDLLEWPEPELLQYEKDTLGLYVTSHPLARYTETLERFNTLRLADMKDMQENLEVNIGGLINSARIYITKQNRKMAFLNLETLEGACEVTVFSDLYEKRAALIAPDTIIMIRARINRRNDEAGLVALDLFPIEEAERELTRALHIRIPETRLYDGTPKKIAELLGKKPGNCDVYLHCETKENGEVTILATSACRVNPARPLRRAIEDLTGEDTTFCSAGMGLPGHDAPKIHAPEEPRWKKRKNAAAN